MNEQIPHEILEAIMDTDPDLQRATVQAGSWTPIQIFNVQQYKRAIN